MNLSAFDQLDGIVVVVLMDLIHRNRLDARLGKHLGGSFGCVKDKAQIRVFLGGFRDLVFIGIPDSDKHAAILLHFIAGGDQALIEGLLQRAGNPQHLAGRLHLRSQMGIHVDQLLKGEHRHLDGHIGGFLIKAGAVSHILQLFAQHRPGSQIHHRHAGDFADIWNGAGGTGVHLDHIQLVVIDQVLDIHQSLSIQGNGQIPGALDDLVCHHIVDVPGGVYGDGVAGMDAGALDVLHNARNQDVLAVADGVDLQLGAHQVFIDQNGVLDLLRQNDRHIFLDIRVIKGDDHVLAAQHVGRPHQHRIPDPVGDLQGFLGGHHRKALGALHVVLFQQLIEPLPVLRHIDAVKGGAQYVDSLVVQELGQLDGGLSAEGHNHAVGLLRMDHAHDVLGGERLEIQPVGGVEICGNRFRVIIDDNHLIARLFQRPDAVDGSVVELDALSDADRAGAEHDDGFPVGIVVLQKFQSLVFLVVGSVEIRSLRREFGGAGIHHFINREPGVGDLAPGNSLDDLIQIAHAFGFQVQLVGQLSLGQLLFHLNQLYQLVEEPLVDLGYVVDIVYGNAPLQGLIDYEQALVVAHADLCFDFRVRKLLQLGAVEGVQGDLRAPDRLHDGFLKGLADGHHLAGSLHLSSQISFGVNKFIKGPLGQLDYYIVDGRLKAGVGSAGNGVFNFVQSKTDGDLGRHLGDGIAGGLGGQGGGTGHTGVYLDDRVFKAVRIQGELDIAASLYLQHADDIQGGGTEHLVFLVRQSHRRSDYDRVPSVNAHRIKVFHGADGDDVALAVPDHLKLDFLPAGYAFFHQHLGDRGKPQAVLRDFPKLLLVFHDTAAGAAQGKGRADNQRVADLIGEVHRALHRIHHLGGDAGLANGFHSILEHLAVLRLVDGLRISAQQGHAVFL